MLRLNTYAGQQRGAIPVTVFKIIEEDTLLGDFTRSSVHTKSYQTDRRQPLTERHRIGSLLWRCPFFSLCALRFRSARRLARGSTSSNSPSGTVSSRQQWRAEMLLGAAPPFTMCRKCVRVVCCLLFAFCLLDKRMQSNTKLHTFRYWSL